MDAWRIALLVIVGLFVVLIVLHLQPAGEARRSERRQSRKERRERRAERRLLRSIRELPLDSKQRVRDALDDMIDSATKPPE